MQAIGRSNALQVMVQASIEGDMGGLLADVNRHVDRIMAARHDTDEARGQIVALRDAADRQVGGRAGQRVLLPSTLTVPI